jgi:hypothetical protein
MDTRNNFPVNEQRHLPLLRDIRTEEWSLRSSNMTKVIVAASTLIVSFALAGCGGGNSAPDSATRIFANTVTGIVGMDGTVLESPVANSRFIAEQRDVNGSGWLNVIRARNLTPVTLVSNTNGLTYTEDGISGATLEVVNTTTNAVTMTLGTLPQGTIMQGTGTLTGTAGYIDGFNVNSTLNPSTRELLYVDTSIANSLETLTGNLR